MEHQIKQLQDKEYPYETVQKFNEKLKSQLTAQKEKCISNELCIEQLKTKIEQLTFDKKMLEESYQSLEQ